MPRFRLALLAAVLVAASATPAQAAVINVSNTNDSGPGSLRQAVLQANSNNDANDTINVPAGTYNLTSGELPIGGAVGQTVLIDGPDRPADPAVVAARGAFRVINAAVTTPALNLTIEDLILTGGNASGNGGGILKGQGNLTIERSGVIGNRATGVGTTGAGGGGIHITGTGALSITQSAITGNSSGPHSGDGNANGGGGIHHQSGGALTIANSTIDGNSTTIGSGAGTTNGGGGIWTQSSSGTTIESSTISSNRVGTSGVAVSRGGGIFNNSFGAALLSHTILAGNEAATGTNCASSGAGFSSDGNNLESHDTCNLTGSGDLPDTNPLLGPPEDNGGGTPTRELLPDSPAINAGDSSGIYCSAQDQRGVDRVVGDECDIGAYEFDGLTVAAIPDCSPTGVIPLTMTPAPGEGVEDFHYKIDGGPEQVADVPDDDASASTVINIPEGRRTLEFWGNFTNGDELDHHQPAVLVDKTRPNVDVRQAGRFRAFVIRRRATANVQAGDALSGLVNDPSGRPRLSTATRGRKTFQRTATDLCGNQSTDSFAYRVLAPALGTRTVLEVLSGNVRFGRRAGGGSAEAAQKGQTFTPLRQPREVPIGTFVDTRRGQVRITSSRNRRTALQTGRFSAGLFQVFQSRRRRARGLTTLTLKGSSFRRCRRGGRGKAARTAQSRLVRRLRANARGRFRTRGRHSAATVRGTVWVTADRCDGTLTSVRRGRVAVRDFRRKRTILVRAGKSYLARAPR